MIIRAMPAFMGGLFLFINISIIDFCIKFWYIDYQERK